MRDKLLCALHGHHGAKIVCALSGGGDSVALLHGLLSVREELGLELTAAHFNHCLRGAESDGDEAFVRKLCQDWNVPLTVGRGDPKSRAGESPEEAARNLRYAFLQEQTGLIATAHHADDQVETVLLNLLRGTGLKGLCGMAFQNGRIIRPLLTVTQAEIADYLQKNALPHRQDSSNLADDALRNRLRHHVLPLLRQENPNLAETVTRMTALLRQDEAHLETETARLLQDAKREQGYHCPTLLAAPEALRSRAIRRLLEIPKPAMHHVRAVEQLLHSTEGSASVQLPDGWIALREYNLLQLTKAQKPAFDPVRLHVGETVHAAGWKITLKKPQIPEKNVDFALKYDMMEEVPSFLVRPRQTGDMLRLSGGQKSVKKLMIDRKIPAAIRDTLPVFEDGHGIFAVYGLGSDVTRTAEPGQPAWVLHIEKEEIDGNEHEQN